GTSNAAPTSAGSTWRAPAGDRSRLENTCAATAESIVETITRPDDVRRHWKSAETFESTQASPRLAPTTAGVTIIARPDAPPDTPRCNPLMGADFHAEAT